jgi:hypothetical protein
VAGGQKEAGDMSNTQEPRDKDELDLDAETVKDLEPREEDSAEARGGMAPPTYRGCGSEVCPIPFPVP